MPHLKSIQRQDKSLSDLINCLSDKTLPMDEQAARNVVSVSVKGFVLVNGVMYYEGGDSPREMSFGSTKSSTSTS